MSVVIDLDAYRRTGEIVVRLPVYYSDARLEFARRIERRQFEMECEEAARFASAVSCFYGSGYAGEKPGDTE